MIVAHEISIYMILLLIKQGCTHRPMHMLWVASSTAQSHKSPLIRWRRFFASINSHASFEASSTAQSHKSPLRWWRFFASITSLDTRTIERYAASFEEYNAQCIEHHAHNHEQLNIRLDRYAPWTHMPPPGLRGTPWFDTLSSSMSHS